MLLLTAAILAAPTAITAVPDQQAKATVRILRAEPIKFQDIERQRPQALRSTVVHSRDGRSEPARLLEYQ